MRRGLEVVPTPASLQKRHLILADSLTTSTTPVQRRQPVKLFELIQGIAYYLDRIFVLLCNSLKFSPFIIGQIRKFQREQLDNEKLLLCYRRYDLNQWLDNVFRFFVHNMFWHNPNQARTLSQSPTKEP